MVEGFNAESLQSTQTNNAKIFIKIPIFYPKIFPDSSFSTPIQSENY